MPGLEMVPHGLRKEVTREGESLRAEEGQEGEF